MCKKKARRLGMRMVSRIGDRRKCEFAIDTSVEHSVEVYNETSSECYTQIVVTCDESPHICTNNEDDDKRWTDGDAARTLGPGQKMTFRGRLIFVDADKAPSLPADQDLKIELQWRPISQKDGVLELYGDFDHRVSVRR